MENKRYYIELEPLTPLSVGAGNENDWICGVDYVQKDGKVYVIDMLKAAQLGVDVNRLATAFASSDEKAVINLMGNRLEQAASRVFDLPVQTTNPIKTFLRTQLMDKPVVPGSSIKGAIRSCLFNDFHGPKINGENTDKINDKVFGSMKDGDVFTRFIHVGDIVLPHTLLVNTKLFNLQGGGKNYSGGWKHGGNNTSSRYQPTGFNTLYECVKPGTKGIGAIDMMNNVFELLCKQMPQQSYLNKKTRVMQGGIKALFNIINNTTADYLARELEFFDKYDTDRVDEIVESIKRILDMIPDDDSYCIMKMSAGVGFHSITGDWIYDDYDDTGIWTVKENKNDAGKKRYKSRKIADYNGNLQLMGFVILRSVDEDGEKRYHEHLECMKESDAEIHRKAETEKLRKAEEDARIAREKEAERRQTEARYDEILQEAKRLADEKKWDEAIAKANEAGGLQPKRNDHINWITLWESQKAIEADKQATDLAAADKFKQPLADVLKPSSLGNLIGTTKNWVKHNGIEAFGETELQALFVAINALPQKEQNQLSRKRKDMTKAIGEQWTASLYELFI